MNKQMRGYIIAAGMTAFFFGIASQILAIVYADNLISISCIAASVPCILLGTVTCLMAGVLRTNEQRLAKLEERLQRMNGAGTSGQEGSYE